MGEVYRARDTALNRDVYAASKDGQRFSLRARPQFAIVEPLTVVVNWTTARQR